MAIRRTAAAFVYTSESIHPIRNGYVEYDGPGERDEEFLGALRRDFPALRVVGAFTVKPKSRYAKKDVSVGIALIPPETEEKSRPAP